MQPLNTIAQPPIRGGSVKGVPRFSRGGNRSIAKLESLNYDPITRLIMIHDRLEKEILYQEKLRAREIVELNIAGKERNYYAPTHHALYDKLIVIGKELIRYKYGRVPEIAAPEVKRTAPLIVNLTQKGEVYVLNDVSDDEDDAEAFDIEQDD